MTFIAIVPLLVAIVGLLLWLLGNGKMSEAGKYLFICGALVSLFAFSGHTVRIGAP